MNALNSTNTLTELHALFLAATRRELETEILSTITVSRSDDAIVFDALGWGKRELLWWQVQQIVHSTAAEDGLDGLCKDVVAAIVDGVEVIQ